MPDIDLLYPPFDLPPGWSAWLHGVSVQIAHGMHPHDTLVPNVLDPSTQLQTAFDAVLPQQTVVFLWRNTSSPAAKSCRPDRATGGCRINTARDTTFAVELPDTNPFTAVAAVVALRRDASGSPVAGGLSVYRTSAYQPVRTLCRGLPQRYAIDTGLDWSGAENEVSTPPSAENEVLTALLAETAALRSKLAAIAVLLSVRD